MFMKFAAIVLAILVLTLPAYAAEEAVAPAMNESWKADIKKAEDYLNNLKEARARFVQTAPDGTQFVGTFYLDRPGRLRFEYDPPVEDFIVADGTLIYFYDSQLQEQSNAPIGSTLADFILRDNIELTGDLAVQNVKRGGDFLQIQVAEATDIEGGSLTLGFKEEPFALKKWRVVDAQGAITEVELFYLRTDVTHPSGLFAYIDPKHGKGGNYNN
jgi:outer membrane lipoprotein-sorting protein